VDTGMGLERILTVVQGRNSVFDCDLFEPWMTTLPGRWELDPPSLRLVSDHLRSVVVVVGDGVRPSNTGRGYVPRRLIRRALTTLWRDDPSRTLVDLPVGPIGETMEHFGLPGDVGPIRDVLLTEERRFESLVRRGKQVVSRLQSRGPLRDEDYGYLHDTHGLPRELVTLWEGGGRTTM